MFNIPNDTSSKFLTFLGLLIVYGGVTYAWAKIEGIEKRYIEIQILALELEEQRELVDEITDARENPIIIDVIKKDDYLFKRFVDAEFFDEKGNKEEQQELSKRRRELMYSSPNEVAKLLKLRAPSREDVDNLDGRLLSLKLNKQRLELEGKSLVNSARFYWAYLIFSSCLGLTFMFLGLFSWRRDEGKSLEPGCNKSMQPTAKASAD